MLDKPYKERARCVLAATLSLRWARLGAHRLGPLLAIGVVLWQWRDAMATPDVGAPLGVWALGVTLATLLGRELAVWTARTTGSRRSWMGLPSAISVFAIVVALAVSGYRLGWDAPSILAASAVTAVAFSVGIALGIAGVRLTRLEFVLLVGVLALWIALDATYLSRQTHLYDLQVYLGSAARWLSGGSPYLTGPLTRLPAHAADDYFLYPPPLLPIFGLVSKLPSAAISIAWVSLLVGSGIAAFRAMGLNWAWCIALILFPPLVKGVESGNIVNLTFLLFIVGAKRGEALVVNGLFKVQSGLPALWLLRERRWRASAGGLGALAIIAIVTLPLVGVGAWQAWLDSLGYRAVSQTQVPILFGASLAKGLPGWAFVALSVGAVSAALLLLRGRRSLAGLGLASVVASPSLWLHGFVFAIPAVLDLESSALVWAVLGVSGFAYGAWSMIVIGALALLAAQRPRPDDALHPLAGKTGLGTA
jgi:hypothetical protein